MKTFERFPPLAETFSAMLVPLQAGSWLISITAPFGAAPSSFTVPLIEAAVAGSIGVAAGVAAALGAAGCSSTVSFLPQPARRTNPSNADRPQTVTDVFFFIWSTYLSLSLEAFTAQKPVHGA